MSRKLEHGGTGTRLYEIWRGMRYRCENPQNKAYRHYGEKGITVCSEWHDFRAFEKWALENGYDEKLSIDRKDNDKGYYPDNCRWVNSYVQMNNRSTCRILDFNNEKLTVSEWSNRTGIQTSTILGRLKRGWSIERTLTEPVRKYRRDWNHGKC